MMTNGLIYSSQSCNYAKLFIEICEEDNNNIECIPQINISSLAKG
jgi:hypothetical protein